MSKIIRIGSDKFGDTIHEELKDKGGVYRIFSMENGNPKMIKIELKK